MPINQDLMDNLKKQYGDKHGEEVYYAMNEGKIKSGISRKKLAAAWREVKAGKPGAGGLMQYMQKSEPEECFTEWAQRKHHLLPSDQFNLSPQAQAGLMGEYEKEKSGSPFKTAQRTKAGVAQLPVDLTKRIEGAPKPTSRRAILASMWKKAKAGKYEQLCDGDQYCLQVVGDRIKHGISEENALQVYVNSVEGDTSQLPRPLATYAKQRGWLRGFKKATPEQMFEQERKEHPSFSDKQIHQIVADHEKSAKFSKEISHGAMPDKIARHEKGMMKEYAEVEAAFMKPGDWHTNGIPYHYDWSTIRQAKDSFKNREFFVGHNEQSGMEYGIIKEVEEKHIDGENWLVGKIRIPETGFTKSALERIETGLTRYVSCMHSFRTDSGRNVVRMTGKAIATVLEPEIDGARILGIVRHIKAG